MSGKRCELVLLFLFLLGPSVFAQTVNPKEIRESVVDKNYFKNNRQQLINKLSKGSEKDKEEVLDLVFEQMPTKDIKNGTQSRFYKGVNSKDVTVRNKVIIEVMEYINKLAK